MITLSKEEFEAFVPQNNNVLVKVKDGNDKVVLSDGTELFIDTTFEKVKHAVTTGTVAKLPEKLVFDMSVPPRSYMEWETDIEACIGDEVIFDYLITLECLEDPTEPIIMCDGQAYFPVPYHCLYVAKRFKPDGWAVDLMYKPAELSIKEWLKKVETEEGYAESINATKLPAHTKIIPLNGYCILEQLSHDQGDFLPDDLRLKTVGNAARIKYLGKPNASYKQKPYSDKMEVKSGDIVYMERNCDIPLEYDLHASLEGNKLFYVCQRRFFNMLVPDKYELTEKGIQI